MYYRVPRIADNALVNSDRDDGDDDADAGDTGDDCGGAGGLAATTPFPRAACVGDTLLAVDKGSGGVRNA